MWYYFKCILWLIAAATLSVLYEKFNLSHKNISRFNESLQLVIGVLSARENFALREAARSTWLKDYLSDTNSYVKIWFIVGKDSCGIPPEYRLSKYSCEKWNINSSGLAENFFTSLESPVGTCPKFYNTFHQGFSFLVNYPVIITKLGILSSLLLPNTTAKIAILDVQTKEIIVQAVISTNGTETAFGYVYEQVETILFPKNFEGLVLVEGYLQHVACTSMVFNDGGGVITFKRVYSTPSHLDSLKYSPNIFVAASIGFHISDIGGLKKVLRNESPIRSKWLSYLRNLNENLELESKQKKDIFFADVIDTYRNLPVKLLHFYKWLQHSHKFLYVMKTDDDSVANIFNLLQKLQRGSRFNSSRHWLWSRFRKEWPLNYIGKWADYDYQASYYPSFPCGAAYILSQKTAHWLSLNSEHLHPYQGEDVSMGIWLSAVNPDFIEDEHFGCDTQCSYKSYNRAQLTANEVYEVWSTFQDCGNLCTCDHSNVTMDTMHL